MLKNWPARRRSRARWPTKLGFEALHGIVDCLWVRGEPVSEFKEAVERDMGILTELDSYDWLVFLPMANGEGTYNRYYGRLNTGKVKIRGVMARKGDTPEYVRSMQQEMFWVMGESRSLSKLIGTEPRVQEVYRKYSDGLGNVDPKSLAIHRRVSRLEYSHRCAEASAVKAHLEKGFSLAPGVDIGYVVRDAERWDVDMEKDASEFDAGYYGKLLEKAWNEVAFAFKHEMDMTSLKT